MNKKYVLHPGNVDSQQDTDTHFISASQLARLYGVKMSDCTIVDYRRPLTYVGRDMDKYIHLYPHSHYELPEK